MINVEETYGTTCRQQAFGLYLDRLSFNGKLKKGVYDSVGAYTDVLYKDHMRVNISVPIRTLRMLWIFCLLGMIALIVILVVDWQRTIDYVKVDGTITSIESRIVSGVQTNTKNSVIREIQFEFTVEGKQYQGKYRAFFVLGKNIGDSIPVHYLRNHPNTMRNRFLYEACIICLLIIGIFFVFLNISIFNLRKI